MQLSLASLGIIAPISHLCKLACHQAHYSWTIICPCIFPDQYHWMHFITIWIDMEGGLFIKCILYFHLYDLYPNRNVFYIVSISLWSMKVNEEGRKRSQWTLNNEHPTNDKLLLYDICIMYIVCEPSMYKFYTLIKCWQKKTCSSCLAETQTLHFFSEFVLHRALFVLLSKSCANVENSALAL